VWSQDAKRVLWANPTAAALFGAPTPAALTTRIFDDTQIATVEVARLAATLRTDGGARLERLRGFGAALGRRLTCSCSHIRLAHGTTAVLIVAIERSGVDLPIDQRVSMLLAGCVQPIAVFNDDGAPVGATPSARRRLDGKTTLGSLGAEASTAAAPIDEHIDGGTAGGVIAVDRIHDPAVWIVTFDEDESRSDAARGTVVQARDEEEPAGAGAGSTEIRSQAVAPRLSALEHHAFLELSRQLVKRINEAEALAARAANTNAPAEPRAMHSDVPDQANAATDERESRPFLDQLPVGVLVYRCDHLLYANPAFLSWAGSDDLHALSQAGGLDSLTIGAGGSITEQKDRQPFSIASPRSGSISADARLLRVPWDGEWVSALLTMPPRAEIATQASLDLLRVRLNELDAIVNTASDGVVILDGAARVLSANRSAQALFGYDAHALEGYSFSDLLAPESVGIAMDYLGRLVGNRAAALLNNGCEVLGREPLGGLIPLFVTMGRIGDGHKYCAIFRDLTPWKKTEDELIAARREAERASAAKSNFIANVSHEIRTPLNTILGLSELMTQERFGPLGNERYRHDLRDIHASGEHLLSLVNDLLELAKIEAGKLELAFTSVSLNDLIRQCVAIMQPQANREGVIIRSSLSPRLPPVMADPRSLRQIVLNVLSNSIKLTLAGGQLILSTAVADTCEVSLRIRDTGVGMSSTDVASALEPLDQVATKSHMRAGGLGLALPLTKALAEANHATFHINSKPNEGTLVEIAFPSARLLAAQ
jgi:PAS domain S-box-containing protein